MFVWTLEYTITQISTSYICFGHRQIQIIYVPRYKMILKIVSHEFEDLVDGVYRCLKKCVAVMATTNAQDLWQMETENPSKQSPSHVLHSFTSLLFSPYHILIFPLHSIHYFTLYNYPIIFVQFPLLSAYLFTPHLYHQIAIYARYYKSAYKHSKFNNNRGLTNY